MSVTGGSHRQVETCGQRSGRCSIARFARGGSRREAAYFVVARRREACQLTPSQHGGTRSAGLIARSVLDCSLRSRRIALGSRCLPRSLADEIATTRLARGRRIRLLAHSSRQRRQSWSLRIALGSRLLRRRSPTRSVSAHSFSTQLTAGAGARYARAIVEARRRTIRGLTARAQCSQLTAEPRASPAFARTRRNSRARRSASKEEMLAPSSSKAASQAASNLAARWAVTR
jgi:hypothetical protein